MAALHTAIYSAASPECLNNDQTPPLTSIAALHTALYSAASPECLNNDQTPPLTSIAALYTALLLSMNALTMASSSSSTYGLLLCCLAQQ